MDGWIKVMLGGVLMATPACERGETEVPGETIEIGMSTPDLARLAHDRSGRVRRCYRDGLAEHPALEGEVTVAIVVGDDGVVERSQVVADQLANETVARCVANSLLGAQLEGKPRSPTPLHLAFAFSPGEGPTPPLALPEPVAHQPRQVVSVQVPMPKQPSRGQPRRDPPGPPAPAP